jgi:DNA-binding transcriptional regulator YdaS (Cro superfamily)
MEGAKTPVEQAIKNAGGGAALAAELNLTRQAIYQWKMVPPQHVLEVERITGVSRHDLRPDLYPREEAKPEPAEVS